MTYISYHTDRAYICAKSKFWKSRGTISMSCETNRKWHGHVQQTIFLPKSEGLSADIDEQKAHGLTGISKPTRPHSTFQFSGASTTH